MKNRLVSILLCILMLISMASVAVFAEEHPANLTVVATNYPLYDMAHRIGGEHLNLVYQPEATAETIQDADILLCMGGEKDAWTAELEGIQVIRAMDGIELIEGDSAILTIPVNVMIAASYFTDALSLMDATHIELYGANLIELIGELSALDNELRKAVDAGEKVFCADGSMAYFAKEYGVEVVENAEDGVVVYAYEYPAEEDLAVPYIELMQRNCEALSQNN